MFRKREPGSVIGSPAAHCGHASGSCDSIGSSSSAIEGTPKSAGARRTMIPTAATLAQVGVFGFFLYMPYAVMGLFGGALADRYDRRRIMMITQTLMAGDVPGVAGGPGRPGGR